MPDTKRIVINTGPIIALVAALGDLKVLRLLYIEVIVPFEVCQEILTGGALSFAVTQFNEADWLKKCPNTLEISHYLKNSIDLGEASVIQMALNEGCRIVCIDETVGRRIAKLNGLMLTGTVGILLRAKKEGLSFSMKDAIQRMISKGVWLGEGVIDFALYHAGEKNFKSTPI